MRLVIFDLDDTLVVEQASAEAAFLETCELAKARYGIDPQTLHSTVRETCRTFWHRSPARAYCLAIGISSWEGLWARFAGNDENLELLRDWAPTYRRNSWYEALRKHGVDDETFAVRLAEEFAANRSKRHVVYDDVPAVLKSLKQSYGLGLLTNGVPDMQREKIDAAGIGVYFDEIVISGEVGVGKPNPQIYEIILSRFGVPPNEAVMIGDSLRSDVKGAQAVGVKAVWLNRLKESRDDTIIPDFEVSNLKELKEAFEQSASPGVEPAVRLTRQRALPSGRRE